MLEEMEMKQKAQAADAQVALEKRQKELEARQLEIEKYERETKESLEAEKLHKLRKSSLNQIFDFLIKKLSVLLFLATHGVFTIFSKSGNKIL